jgi:hypothetical protein
MIILARKITRQKWLPRGNLRYQNVPLDGVTYDLRTDNHTLSLWTCDPGTPTSVEEVALLLAASRDTIDRLDIAFVAQSELERRKIKIKPTLGNTTIDRLKDRHRDIAELNLQRFCSFSRILNDAIKGDRWKRFSRKEIQGILIKAVDSHVVSFDKLSESIRNEIGHHIASS